MLFIKNKSKKLFFLIRVIIKELFLEIKKRLPLLANLIELLFLFCSATKKFILKIKNSIFLAKTKKQLFLSGRNIKGAFLEINKEFKKNPGENFTRYAICLGVCMTLASLVKILISSNQIESTMILTGILNFIMLTLFIILIVFVSFLLLI